ncbi:uncharacterized protein BP5553_09949 [Venustampulla echinocandica]|uniref:NADPH-dependent FMN reductase-like domain-containing protein n=1 Tax=Venustampulla echinocandica TaxID=2656787 RepID=A0A370TB43_9HELO|nr:uncharacterized protein BP5553_09949 [Venustampulla echinocandica]RDL31160.1 hypothetical protein BP5553_09949 [Venustampulla echinocandica]
MSSTSAPTPLIGVIVCSSRQPRVCPQIAALVTSTIENWTSTSSDSPPRAKLQLIDLAVWNLPMFDEPTIPSQIKNYCDYAQPHTRAWSQEIQKYAGFIFILPQYNWGYPAVIKNAIDYLFNEWRAKPAMIVSYGGHGGTKSAGQLRQVLDGVNMNVAETMPALAFPDRTVLVKAAKGDDLNLGEESRIWTEERKDIYKAFEDLMALVSKTL